jgi:hypothetical protein
MKGVLWQDVEEVALFLESEDDQTVARVFAAIGNEPPLRRMTADDVTHLLGTQVPRPSP